MKIWNINLSNSNKDMEIYKIMYEKSAYQSIQIVEAVIDPNLESTKI